MTVSEDLYYTLFSLLIMTSLISLLMFGRLSMARIEKEFRAEGKPIPVKREIYGLHITTYVSECAYPFSLSKLLLKDFYSAPQIKPYIRTRDRVLARVHTISVTPMLIWLALDYWLFTF